MRKLLGQILKERAILHEGQIQEALAYQREHGGLLGKILIDMKFASEEELAIALGIQAGFEFVDLDKEKITPDVLSLVDSSTASVFGILPLRLEGKKLIVALSDPWNRSVLDDLHFLLNREIVGKIASAKKIKEQIAKHYGDKKEQVSDAVAAAKKIAGGGDSQSLAKSAPLVRLLNSILQHAIRDRASDIHFELFQEQFRIRYRVDGALYEIEAPPAHLAPALVSRIKVLANLDIAETRLPQDGRIELSIEGRPVDLRVATMPGLFGESCVLRVLDRSVVSLDLGQLGLRPEELAETRKILDLPHGIVLVTGPTGSGKTTTLYSMLSAVNDPSMKIITAEDPVEYDLEGVIQVPIREEIGVDYARVLRTVLRQDPDIILVGEIRDAETAQVAVEASLTGHLVFSTLHTNDAPSAVTRLVDMGVEPFLITATLEAIIAQRLVRRICSQCKQSYKPPADLLRELGISEDLLSRSTFYFGKGCEACYYSGYRGRVALFEILHVNETIRQLILDRASTNRIREEAQKSGMRGLRDSGLFAITEGWTTVEEVVRETLSVE